MLKDSSWHRAKIIDFYDDDDRDDMVSIQLLDCGTASIIRPWQQLLQVPDAVRGIRPLACRAFLGGIKPSTGDLW